MKQKQRKRSEPVIGPDGAVMTARDLPPRGNRRWVSRQKAQVVAAVDGGLLSLDEACLRYEMSVEEFLSWQRAWATEGQQGLRATRRSPARAAKSTRPPNG